ncbi:MAG: integrase [Candidatus Azotimanducaceae bacterium]|jgi:integrase
MYGSGLRIGEAVSLRVKDIDFGMKTIAVRNGKRRKDRVTILPSGLHKRLQKQIEFALDLHQLDLLDGFGEVYMPDALGKKYLTAASEPVATPSGTALLRGCWNLDMIYGRSKNCLVIRM